VFSRKKKKKQIPEFFYLPEFLVNSNGLDLGTKADGMTISDVVLPPWANGDPRTFIQVNREALESGKRSPPSLSHSLSFFGRLCLGSFARMDRSDLWPQATGS
jgi:hypothetical protein